MSVLCLGLSAGWLTDHIDMGWYVLELSIEAVLRTKHVETTQRHIL